MYFRHTFRNIYTIIVFFVFIIFSNSAVAQISNYVSSVNAEEAKELQDATISISFFQTQAIANVTLHYRTFGESEYKNAEVLIKGATGSVVIPKQYVNPPFIEYYLSIEFRNGDQETYPQGFPFESVPLQLRVVEPSPKDKEVIIMSPEQNSLLSSDEFFVSISLLRASDDVNKPATKIFIDNIDISELALFSDDLILFSGENFPQVISLGSHLLRVELYDNSNQLYHVITSRFVILTSEQKSYARDKINYRVNMKGEARSENIRNASSYYNNLSVDAAADYQSWETSANIYITSEEKAHLQPFNRYSLSIRNDWLNLDFGDNFPRYPSNIMSGKRVRGINGAINLGFFNLQMTLGEITRGIDGDFIRGYKADDVSFLNTPNVISIDSTKYFDSHGQPFVRALVNLGTYKRNLFALRPSFGSGKNFQLGFTYLHGQDAPNSIEFGVKPKENLVLGTDLLIALDDQKVLFTAQGSFSLLNTDIATGQIKDENNLIDSLSKSIGIDASTFRKLRDILGTFITINQFLTPLNPQELPTVAAEAALSFNYFGNFLKASYLYRGNDYISFGQNFLRTDVAGINVMDRIRLFQNKLFLSIGYENLSDNIQNTKLNTTNYQAINSSVSYYPRADLPGFMLSYSNFLTKNDAIDTSGFFLNNITSRVGVQVTYSFDYLYKHQAAFSFSQTSGDDKTKNDYDISNFSSFFTAATIWSDDIQSNLALSINQSEVRGIKFDYTTISLGGRYSYIKDKLNFNASVSPSFGDLKRNLLELSSQYFILKNLDLRFSFRYINYSGGWNDTVIGLTTNYSFY